MLVLANAITTALSGWFQDKTLDGEFAYWIVFSIPAFMIPLRVAGEVVRIESAGMSYAFLMAISNVTNTFEGLVGGALFWLFTRPEMFWLLQAFAQSPLDIADVTDTRTLVLQIFVYLSLFFTLLAVPVVVILKTALIRHGIRITNSEADVIES